MKFYGILACKQNSSFYFHPILINFQNIFYPLIHFYMCTPIAKGFAGLRPLWLLRVFTTASPYSAILSLSFLYYGRFGNDFILYFTDVLNGFITEKLNACTC